MTTPLSLHQVGLAQYRISESSKCSQRIVNGGAQLLEFYVMDCVRPHQYIGAPTSLTFLLYEQAFDSRRLQNSQIPQTYKERPSSYEGFTQIIANDCGHLKPGVPRSKDSPWGGFVGTWDMPKKIPGNVTTYMARGDPAVDNIQKTRAEHNEYMRQAVSPDKTLPMEPKPQVTKVAEEERPGNPSPKDALPA